MVVDDCRLLMACQSLMHDLSYLIDFGSLSFPMLLVHISTAKTLRESNISVEILRMATTWSRYYQYIDKIILK